MARKYLFVDEAGNFDFSLNGSSYFILTSIALEGCTVGDQLLELRRELIWEGGSLSDAFHATTDVQAVRDRVFAFLAATRVSRSRIIVAGLFSENGSETMRGRTC